MSDRGAYGVAVSFAGAQRSMAKNYARACQMLAVSVFYDDYLAGLYPRDEYSSSIRSLSLTFHSPR